MEPRRSKRLALKTPRPAQITRAKKCKPITWEQNRAIFRHQKLREIVDKRRHLWRQLSTGDIERYINFIKSMRSTDILRKCLLRLIDCWYMHAYVTADIAACAKLIILDSKEYFAHIDFDLVENEVINSICEHERTNFERTNFNNPLYPSEHILHDGLLLNLDPGYGDRYYKTLHDKEMMRFAQSFYPGEEDEDADPATYR
jgi:hypothetical protein